MNEKVIIADRIKRKLLRLFLFATALFVLSFAVLYLWNSILPHLIYAGTIGYWQALGLLLLCRLLFGNINIWYWRGWQNKYKRPDFFDDKLINVTEEDKAAFKAEWRKRREWKER